MGLGYGLPRAKLVLRSASCWTTVGTLALLAGALSSCASDPCLTRRAEAPATPRPGDHTLRVLLQLRGNGYGVFAYLRGYRFEVKANHAFSLDGRRPLRLEVVAWERDDAWTPLEGRPAICYVEL
jgi:hypothetical protein